MTEGPRVHRQRPTDTKTERVKSSICTVLELKKRACAKQRKKRQPSSGMTKTDTERARTRTGTRNGDREGRVQVCERMITERINRSKE